MFYKKTTLDNGVRVVTESMESAGSLSIGIWFNVGSRDETASEAGISHLLEHMMFKGTDKLSALDISLAFDSMGAELNAFTSKEYTCYFARTTPENTAKAFEILAAMVTEPSFRQSELDSEREVVIEEIARYEDQPEDHIFDLFGKALFPEHPVGLPIIGTRASVASFNHAECKNYHKKHYHGGNCVVAVAGAANHDELVALATKHLSGLENKPTTARELAVTKAPIPLAGISKPVEQAHILYGTRSLAADDKDRFAASVMRTVLGGPMSSRLFQEVREKRGLVYAIYASAQPYIGTGQFIIYAGTRPDNSQEVLELINKEIGLFKTDGITASELAWAKDYVCGHVALSLESTSSRMIKLGQNTVNGLELLSLEQTLERYKAVTIEDVRRVIERVLGQQPVVTVISPQGPDQFAEFVGAL